MDFIPFIRSRRYLTVLSGFVLLAVGVTLLFFVVRVLPDLFAEVTASEDGIPELARFDVAIPVRQPGTLPGGEAGEGEAELGDDPLDLPGAGGVAGAGVGFRPIKGVTLGSDTLVLDAAAGSVLFLTPEGALSEVVLERPRVGGIDEPRFTDLELSDTGTLLVSDLANGQVWIYALDGRYLAPLLDPVQRQMAALTRPSSVTRDAEGRLLVADVGDHRVKVFNKAGELLLVFGGFGFAPGRMNYPTDVAVGTDGDLYVADSENRRIQVFSPRGEYRREFRETGTAAGLVLPRTLAFDGQGRLHVVDPFEQRVWVFSPADGVLLGEYGVDVTAEARFSLPEAVAIAGDRVVVGDRGNGRLVVYRL